MLAAWALDRDQAWLLAHPEADVSHDEASRFRDAVERRATGEPVAYIRGFKEWFSLRIRVDARGLIPRSETELLAEAAIREVASRLSVATWERPLVVWDVGTGSGCLAVAIGLSYRNAARLGRVRLVASDASRDALELAAENVAAHGLADVVELLEADLLDGVEAAPPATHLPAPDVVVANLPYVPSDEVDRLPAAASFEPRSALDGGRDGLDAIRALIADLPRRLPPGGAAVLEIGAGQAAAVRAHAAASALVPTDTMRDLAGIERVVRIAREA